VPVSAFAEIGEMSENAFNGRTHDGLDVQRRQLSMLVIGHLDVSR